MQALEDQENAVSILRLDPDPVIGDGERPVRPVPLRGDDDARRLLAPELERVAEQVLEHRGHERQLSPHDRQRPGLDHGAGLLDLGGQGRLRGGKRSVAGHGPEVRRRPADAAEREQVVDQHLHPLGSVHGEVDVLVGPLVELAAVAALQQLAEAGDLPQRFLEVVRGDVRELLEFGVGALEVGRLSRE